MELHGSKCTLRPFRTEDAEELAIVANNRNIWRNLTSRFPHPYAIEDAQSFIARSSDESMAGRIFCIEVEGRVSGGIGCHRLEDAIHEHELEFGYWLAEPCWGRGIATEACKLMVDHIFSRFGVMRLQACVFGWNPASARVLEKNGFTLEGRLRKAVKKGDEYCDMLIYGLVR
ncbi:MAG: GNAT family N-acetyltransferase [Candidatus Hydrogenedentes bacterium]|nr:GNAT family N-acetyltransferase [Candidatus Hydrogenedentota bacterium]